MNDRTDQAAEASSPNRPLVFISHRHEDADIADVLRQFMYDRSGGAVDVFQSSSADAQGPRAGAVLNRALADQLWNASIIILLYTDPDHDWSYPMWECGVATQPASPDTRPLVLHCSDSTPPVFAGRTRFDIRKQDAVQSFMRQFLTDPTFFPDRNTPLTQFAAEGESVREAATALHAQVQGLLPGKMQADEWFAYPFLRLYLSLGQESLLEQKVKENGLKVVLEECKVDQLTGSFASALFGMAQPPADEPLRVLVAQWEQQYPDATEGWVESLCQQIVRGAGMRFPEVPLELMRSVQAHDRSWYAPVLNCVRKVPKTRHLEFDVYFNRFDVDEQHRVRAGLQDTG